MPSLNPPPLEELSAVVMYALDALGDVGPLNTSIIGLPVALVSENHPLALSIDRRSYHGGERGEVRGF